jgi:hypothetical protein
MVTCAAGQIVISAGATPYSNSNPQPWHESNGADAAFTGMLTVRNFRSSLVEWLSVSIATSALAEIEAAKSHKERGRTNCPFDSPIAPPGRRGRGREEPDICRPRLITKRIRAERRKLAPGASA